MIRDCNQVKSPCFLEMTCRTKYGLLAPRAQLWIMLYNNRNKEAFFYCAPDAQANVRSSIPGALKGAKEAQREFLILMEDFIRKPDISKSVQLAIGETKVRPDLAISLTKLFDWITTIDREKSHVKVMKQRWHNNESACLSPVWFDPWAQRHGLVNSWRCSWGFSLQHPTFLSSKIEEQRCSPKALPICVFTGFFILSPDFYN